MADDHIHRVAVIGAGPGGICTGIRLLQSGVDDFVILEKADGVGGTWWHNRYPGAECDVQSHLYSFSFELKPDWSRPYARQAEILGYLEHCAGKYGVTPYVRFGDAVEGLHWQERDACWQLATAAGRKLRARCVVAAQGMFNEPAFPDLAGLDTFAGVTFHSARWRHDHPLTGRRVAVIGSAASAVQFIPEIAPQVDTLTIYQRTANWVLPKHDTPYTAEQIERFRRDPRALAALRNQLEAELEGIITLSDPEALRAAEAAGLENLSVVRDPAVREKLVPRHPFGCKRPLLSNVYYPVFNEPHVQLVTEPIARIVPRGIVTADGRLREADTLILATGFRTGLYLSALDVVGRGGRRLDDAWAEGAEAYLGMVTPGFPNLFMLYGPNTNNGCILTMLELQVDYVLRALEHLETERLAWLDVRADVCACYNATLQREIAGVAVWQAGCNGYYRAPSGRVVTQWPHTMAEFARRTRQFDPNAYEVYARAS